MSFLRSVSLVSLGLAFPAVLAPLPAAAQSGGGIEVRNEVFVNSEIEHYLRLLQLTGEVRPYPWSIRSFSPREVDRLLPVDSAHPWQARYRLEPGRRGPEAKLIRPHVETIYNSAFAHGANRGPLWAGRGLTTGVQMGASARWGPVSLTLAPVTFWAQNSDFAIGRNNREGKHAFGDWLATHVIDLPQRFGDEPYARLDPGQSTLRVDLRPLAIGLSTANQHWGPALEHPMLLGNNAPGYLHGFIGTSEPFDLWIGRLHARAVWGRLEPSDWTMKAGHGSRRLMSGYVAHFSPRGLPGLEVGVSRFFHEAWPRDGLKLEDLRKPFETFLKERLADPDEGDFGDSPDNQLASLFARWVFPRAGFEVYGEFGREDHSWDQRDFLIAPDQNSGYALGFRKAWPVREGAVFAVRGEVLNTLESHIKQVREQSPFYLHTDSLGHTHRGQLLGSAAGYGGSGSVLAADYVHPGGRLSVAWRRQIRYATGEYWWDRSPETLVPEALDVIHSLGGEALLFRGRWDVTAGLSGVYNLNRFLESDVFNLHASLQVRAGL